jgi:prolyl-tRNA synthetase
MGNRWALQAGTSHFLGQNFAKAFGTQYLDENNELQYVWQTSWGVSTRMVGAIVMVHGDDQGLRLPPRLAPTQVVVVPIWKSDAQRAEVMAVAQEVTRTLEARFRCHLDSREDLSPGFKFNDWEMRGVPLRVELGPRDVAKEQAVLVRRDLPRKQNKSTAALETLTAAVGEQLEAIQGNLFAQASCFLQDNTQEPKTYGEFQEAVGDGFALAYWCGSAECEAKIKDETKATLRCIPLKQDQPDGNCVCCGEPASERAVFARAY